MSRDSVALTVPDDRRLVSMVKLGIIKERLHKEISRTPSDPLSTPPDVYAILDKHRSEFDKWTAYWDAEFVKHRDQYEDCEFQRQSLAVQRMFAELFHNATALRGIRGPEYVASMPDEERQLAQWSINLAKKGLETCLRSPNYRNGLKSGRSSPFRDASEDADIAAESIAVHFTHVSATFAGSFLIRLARLL